MRRWAQGRSVQIQKMIECKPLQEKKAAKTAHFPT
jgi:hypothetical protein